MFLHEEAKYGPHSQLYRRRFPRTLQCRMNILLEDRGARCDGVDDQVGSHTDSNNVLCPCKIVELLSAGLYGLYATLYATHLYLNYGACFMIACN